MTVFIRTVFGLLVVLSGVATFACRNTVKVTEALDLSQTFLDTASLLFAIIGAWLALFFPRYFEQLFGGKADGAESSRKNVEMLRALLACLLLSGGVIVLNLAVAYAAPYRAVIVSGIGRPASLCALLSGCWLSFVFLVYCLVSALAPALEVLVRDDEKKADAERRARLHSRVE
jgi:hypothetical protein